MSDPRSEPACLTEPEVKIFAATQVVVLAIGWRFEINQALRTVVTDHDRKTVECPRGWIQG